MSKRKQQSEERRNQILLCGLDMIISRGYEATKIRDIAARLQISLGLFFNYFESKESLYRELVTIGMIGPEQVMSLGIGSQDPLETLEGIAEAICQSIRCDSLTAKMFILMAQAIRSESTPDSIREMLKDFDSITPVAALIEKGQALGQIKEGDPQALSVAFWGSIQGIAEFVAVGPYLPLPESRWIIDIIKKHP